MLSRFGLPPQKKRRMLADKVMACDAKDYRCSVWIDPGVVCVASGTVIPHGETGGLQIEDHSNFVYKIAPFIETRARGCPIRRGRAQITGQFEKRQEQYRANNDPGSCQVGKSSADTIQYVYYRLHFLLDARAVYAQKNMLECNGTAKDPGEVLKTVWLTNSRRKLFHHMQDVCWFASGIGELHRVSAMEEIENPSMLDLLFILRERNMQCPSLT